jgi:hypothetical protein
MGSISNLSNGFIGFECIVIDFIAVIINPIDIDRPSGTVLPIVDDLVFTFNGTLGGREWCGLGRWCEHGLLKGDLRASGFEGAASQDKPVPLFRHQVAFCDVTGDVDPGADVYIPQGDNSI